MKEPHGIANPDERLDHLSLAQLKELRKESGKFKKRTRLPPLVPQVRGRILPLSCAQERLWFLDQLGLVGPAYSMPVALRLEGELNVTALERSITELIRRHESLRTRFEAIAGCPIQVVDPAGSFELEIRDLSAIEARGRAQQIERQSNEDGRLPFDLARGPLLRISLLKFAQQDHVLLMTLHHIVFDGWSRGVLHREIVSLYAAYSQGRPSPLQELPIQYVDYAIWQRRWLSEEVLQEHLQYWRERLLGAPPQLELPADRPRPSMESFRGAELRFDLSAGLSTALKDLVRREGATLFMVALAAYQILLSRWSGQHDIVVGSPIAGRGNREVEGLIGFFVNMLVLRTDLSENVTFRHLLERVKDVTLGAYAHQDLPFEALVKDLRPDRTLARHPIFQVVLALQNYPEERLELPGLTWTWADPEWVNTHFDLTLYLSEHSDGLSGMFEYATDLFDEATIERMAGHFRTLLEAIVADPDRPIQQLKLLGEMDRERVLHLFNDTAVSYPENRLIHELFEAQAERTPEAVAVVCGNQQLTYERVNCRGNQIAHMLVSSGVRPDERVGLYVERSVEMVIGLLGILKAGGAYVPLDQNYPAERLAYMLTDSAPVVVLTRERLKGVLPAGGARLIAIDEEREEVSSESVNLDALHLGLKAHHLAYVIYTSGSTGTPKGVMVTHRNVANLVHWHCAAFGLCEGSRSSCVASVGFDAATWEIWPPLSVGATLVLASAEISGDAEALLSWWTSQQLDISFLPTPIAELAFSRNIRNAKLRTLLVGGDRLRNRPMSQSFALINNYGPTESTVVATSGCIRDEDKVLHIGRPIANTQIYILDQHRRPVPIGVVGEIYVGGAGVARGYLNRPELTAEQFLPDLFGTDPNARMYKTGDFGRWRVDGVIEYLGRNDHQVKIRGFRIELGEIETQLLQHSQVKDAVVMAREDDPEEKRLVAYVVADSPHLKALRWEGADGAGAGIVAQWKTLYEETYSAGAPGPSFWGWNSSYTGQPLPQNQMQEWLACAVERIKALRLGKVLEIGCGVGLLLQHLAPHCVEYVGTDFSASALDSLRQWMSGRENLRHVELLHRSATELQDLKSGSFDTVVMNSVVQYFPDIDYLVTVLQEAVRLLGPGGTIFIGDVRHLGLLPMFHSAVQLGKAAATVSVGQLKRRIARAIAQEKELVIDPQFFQSLPGRLPGISGVKVYLKRGRAANELTRYRYDVMLHVDERIEANAVYESLDWQTDVGSAAELEVALERRRWDGVRLHSIPNSRLAREAAAQKLIETSDEGLEASVVRRRLDALQLDATEDPETFWELGQAHGYNILVSWSSPGPAACFEVQFLDRARSDQRSLSVRSTPAAVKPWSAYANDPLENGFKQQLVPQLREYLKGRLPEYMIPTAWMILKQLPLTPNGKVDRRALPAVPSRPEELGEYVAPRTELERTLADIWAQVLRVDQVGVQDNFFELGGHSLLATQVVVRTQSSLSVEMPMKLLFEFPTIQQLAPEVAALGNIRLLNEIQRADNDMQELLEKVASMPEDKVQELLRELRPEGRS